MKTNSNFVQNSNSVIEVSDLSFGYEKDLVLKKINLTFYQNKITAIIGQSGSGKSTLASLLIGLLEKQSGSIKLNDQIIEKSFGKNNLQKITKIIFQNSSDLLDTEKTIYSILKTDIDVNKKNIFEMNLYKNNFLKKDKKTLENFALKLSNDVNKFLTEIVLALKQELDKEFNLVFTILKSTTKTYEVIHFLFLKLIEKCKTLIQIKITQINSLDEKIKKEVKKFLLEKKDFKYTKELTFAKEKYEIKSTLIKLWKRYKWYNLQEERRINIINLSNSKAKNNTPFEKKELQDKLKNINNKMKYLYKLKSRLEEFIFGLKSTIKVNDKSKIKWINNYSKELLILDLSQKLEINLSILENFSSNLSFGQIQRISLMRSILTKPKFLIADEPTAFIDTLMKYKIIDLFKKMNHNNNMGIIFISHDLEVVKYISDYIYLLKDGKIHESGKTMDFFNNPKNKYTKTFLDNWQKFSLVKKTGSKTYE